MKNTILLLAAGAAAICFQACSDDMGKNSTLPSGTEIKFGAVLDNASDSRTYYGPDTIIGGQKVWPIYWNYEAGKLDRIFIYSPQADPGRNQATYIVDPKKADSNNAADISKAGPYGIQTGADAETYDFFAIYPAKYVTGNATGNSISASLPGQQNLKYDGLFPENGNSGENYILEPNMDYCMMTGTHYDVKLDNKPVSIGFSPYSSVIDITVNAPNGSTSQTVKVTSVMLEANAPISGDFSIDFTDPQNPAFSAGKNASNTISINFADNAQNNAVPLTNGNKLNLKAFILPNPAVTSIKVTVVDNTAKTWTKTLNMSAFAPKQIHPVKLPYLTADKAQLDYSIWLSQIDPRVYVSEISLPGASAAFSAVLNDGDKNKQQTKSLTELFEAGIRVFQSHVWIDNQTSQIDGGATSILISVNGSRVSNNGRYLSLGDVITSLTNEMATNHSDEFCVLLLSDYNFKDTPFTQAQFFDRLKTALGSEQMKKYIATDFGPETTIGDLKGKVLVKFAANESGKANFSDLTGTNALFNLWTGNSSEQVNYSNLVWGSATSLTNSTSFTAPAASQMLFIHSEQTNPVRWASPTSTAYDWDTHVSDQIAAYHNRYSADTHNIFGMTYLGGSGDTRSSTSNTVTITPTQVANHYNPLWIGAVNAWGATNSKPYGWVLLNMVGIQSSNDIITKVIEHNANITLKKKNN